MIVIALNVVLYGLAGGLLLWTLLRDRDMFLDGLAGGLVEFSRILPQLAVGMIGAGFLAEAIPQGLVVRSLGNSGPLGVALSAIAGALTPGGAVVGFAIAAATLKAGAGTVPVLAYVTGWSLYGLTRILAWEMPTLPRNVFIVRIIVAAPLAFIAAGLAALLQ